MAGADDCGQSSLHRGHLHRCAARCFRLPARLARGSLDADGTLTLTVTASTVRPIQLSFSRLPSANALRDAIEQHITDELYHTDIHGKPLWRKHMTLRLAEEIRDELLGAPPS